MPETPPPRPALRWLPLLLALGVVWTAAGYLIKGKEQPAVPFSELKGYIAERDVDAAELSEDFIRLTLKPKKTGDKERTVRVERVPNIDDSQLVEELVKAGATVRGTHDANGGVWLFLLNTILPIAFVLFLFSRLGSMSALGRGGPLSFGKSRAKLHDQNTTNKVRFADVAGVEEAKAELSEVVDFLREPKKYTNLGARIPKGVLLVGPPGTGKTLIARAVAGEADVPFFSLSGSEFVEMFVGVGASRVRDLFSQAKERAPCIIFIDELDAIGKSRGGLGTLGTNDEREQTLNQLLTEMDGFDATEGVILIAATNRPEVLDPALLRAGRFDRQVVLDRPDVRERRQILDVHVRKLRLSAEVELDVIARRTPGMSGADLANIVNEAALAAARRGSSSVEARDFEEAADRLQLGLKRRSAVIRPNEKRRVAYHEAGHALVALSLDHTDPVHRVTIIPRSIGALGATLQLPTDEHYLVTAPELHDQICVMLGGRAAELLVTGELSTGAQNDLERATETARQMICRFGMSDRLGPRTYGQPSPRFLPSSLGLGESRNYSEAAAELVDAEIKRILEHEQARALRCLGQRRSALESMVASLLEHETLEREELERIVAQDASAAFQGEALSDQ